jgi:hypothetical protein
MGFGELLFSLFLATPGAVRAAPAQSLLRPCLPGSAPHTQAWDELKAIDTAIAQLPPDATTADLIGRLRRLEKSRCLEMIDGLEVNEKTPAEALRAYWQEGARGHLESFLDLGQSGDVVVFLPPTVRQVLGADVVPPGHPMHPLVCPPADHHCGVEALGWALRAQEALDARARSEGCDDEARRVGDDVDVCNARALRAAPTLRFRRYLDCRAATQLRGQALPLGRLRAPTAGWLTLSGRRGHYDFCDEFRAFDLATGALVRLASCSGLVLLQGGAVDPRATDARRQVEVEIGHVPVAALRETAWMLLMLDTIQRRVVLDEGVTVLDPKIPRILPKPSGFGSGRGCSSGGGGSSGDTHLEWRVLRDGQLLGGGGVTWPASGWDEAEAHATALLRIAEAAFVPGCPTAAPPRGLLAEGLALRVNKLDGDASSRRGAGASLEAAWKRALDDLAACQKAAAKGKKKSED